MRRYPVSVLLLLTIVLLLIASASSTVSARIKLATLPVRERVEIQLDNDNTTLVEEERIVPLLKWSAQTGNNFIDFSWSNTSIDKSSILFRPIAIRNGEQFDAIKKVKLDPFGEVEEVSVINVAFPPNENALVWEVFAARACAVKVRVSYLISNLSRSFSYRALANKDETTLTLSKYLQIRNYSGESFSGAGVWAGFGTAFNKVVDNSTDIKVLMHNFKDVKINKTFTFDWYTNGRLNADKPFASKILMHYNLKNTTAGGMGLFPMQPGKVRIFVDDGRNGEAFLGEDIALLTPIDGEMDLYLGESRDIVCTRTIDSNVREVKRGNLFNQNIVIKYEIENFRDKPATLRILEQVNRLCAELAGVGNRDTEWEKGSQTSSELKIDMEKGITMPMLLVDLPAAPADKTKKVEKVVVKFHITLKNCWN